MFKRSSFFILLGAVILIFTSTCGNQTATIPANAYLIGDVVRNSEIEVVVNYVTTKTFITDLFRKLKYYDQSVMIDILTAALENKYPQLKQI